MTEERKEQYKTVVVLCVALGLIGWRFHLTYISMAGGVLFLLALLSRYMLGLIAGSWVWIGEKIGAVMSRVILSLVFIAVLTPIALLYRWFGKRDKRARTSYFIERNHIYKAEDMEKAF